MKLRLTAGEFVHRYFSVPLVAQARVLKWGVAGAMVLRATMISLGSLVVGRFQVVMLLFSAILIYQGYKLAFVGEDDDDDEDLSGNRVVKAARWMLPVTEQLDGDNFFVKEKNRCCLRARAQVALELKKNATPRPHSRLSVCN